MNKIIPAFLMSVVCMPVMAENWIQFKAAAIEETITNRISESHRTAVANEYEKQMDQTTGKISVMGIYKVCAAAGMDINTTDGYSLCRNFINEIAEKSGFGLTGNATQANCASKLNGIWTLGSDGKTYQCVGRDGHKLVYQKSCAGADGECVKSFSKLQTQAPIGREFIMSWAELYNLPLTCYGEYETRRGITSPLGQDYIMCSAGGKSYEFEFDDLNQNPGEKSVTSENRVMCEFFGGEIIDTGDASVEKFWHSCDIPQFRCNGELQRFALRIGHNSMYQGFCRLSRDVKSTGAGSLRSIDGIDSRIFYDNQMRVDQAVVQLEQYLRKQFPTEGYITCDPNIKKFNYGLGLDIDYVLTCTVGTRTVDFLFDDLTEGLGYKADAGAAAMACTISGGRYAGKHCRGLTESECTLANDKIPGGTRWDDKAGACVLNDAARAQTINNGITIATGVVITVGTLGAMGAVGVVAISAEVAASIAIDLAFNGLERLEETRANRFALNFMRDAQGCSDTSCAMDIVTNHFAKLEEISGDLNDEQAGIVALRMDEIVGMLSDEEFDLAIGLTKSGPGKMTASFGLMTISMLVNPTKGVQKIASKAPRLAKQIERVASHADDIARTASHADDAARAANKVAHNSDEVAGIAKQFNKDIILRSAADNSLEHDYYRIMISDGDDYTSIVEAFRRQGYYVGANSTKGEQRFIGVSKENIFGPWAGLDFDWIMKEAVTTADKAGELSKLDGTIDDAISYLKRAGNGAQKNADNIVSNTNALRKQASSNFDKYLDDFKRTGANYGLPKERLSNAEWQQLEKSLESEGIGFALVNDGNYMTFRKLNVDNVVSKADNVAHVASNADDEIKYLKRYLGDDMRGGMENGVNVFTSSSMSASGARHAASQMDNNKYIVRTLGTDGTSNGAEMVIAVPRQDAAKLGSVNGNEIIRTINRDRVRIAQNKLGGSIGNIRGHDIKLVGLGAESGRPIALVEIKGRTVPFYISSGLAGKTNVPTGKWEFFGGIGSSWFNKGTERDILNHYNSDELRSIANQLDKAIGDIRTQEDVLLSIGRNRMGGVGKVATGSSADLGGIDVYAVNQSFRYRVADNTGQASLFYDNLNEIRNWLRSL